MVKDRRKGARVRKKGAVGWDEDKWYRRLGRMVDGLGSPVAYKMHHMML